MDSEHVFATGAKRSEVKPFYDCLTMRFLRRVALRCTGAPKGGPPLVAGGFEYAGGSRGYGRGNWRKGLPMEDTFNHALEHLLHWREEVAAGRLPADDDLAAVAWGVQALMEFEGRYADLHRRRLAGEPQPDGSLVDFGAPHRLEAAQ